MVIDYIERRISERARTTWPVECRLGGITTTGVIRDVSADGAFVAFGPASPPPIHEPGLTGKGLEVGDQMVLRFRPGQQEPAVQAIASLRWAGYSADHHRFGYGFQFEPG